MEKREQLLGLRIADAVENRLGLLAGGDELFLAQPGKMLRQSGLAEATRSARPPTDSSPLSAKWQRVSSRNSLARTLRRLVASPAWRVNSDPGEPMPIFLSVSRTWHG
jgi:hypothetical protein